MCMKELGDDLSSFAFLLYFSLSLMFEQVVETMETMFSLTYFNPCISGFTSLCKL